MLLAVGNWILRQETVASSGLRRPADRVSHCCAARAERLWSSGGGIACRLMLDFGVKFGAEQNHDYRQPHPGHKSDYSPERTVSLLKLPKLAAYKENRAEAASHTMAAKALPHVIHCQRGSARLGPYR
jgi:hypothetical protein